MTSRLQVQQMMSNGRAFKILVFRTRINERVSTKAKYIPDLTNIRQIVMHEIFIHFPEAYIYSICKWIDPFVNQFTFIDKK